jgi:hexosaminidase
VWTEYMNIPKDVEYMIFPRIMALSEVLWGTSNSKKYSFFQDRMRKQFLLLEKKGINYSKAIFEVTGTASPSEKGILFALQSVSSFKGIRYTTDMTNPKWTSTAYTTPIQITQNQTVKATYFEDGKPKSNVFEQSFHINKATGKKIVLLYPPHQNYNTGGSFALVDGISGNRSKFGRDWLGFLGKEVNATIDFGKEEVIKEITVSVLESKGSWIYYPTQISLLGSTNGHDFIVIQHVSLNEMVAANGNVKVVFNPQKIQFIKIIATPVQKIAEGMPGAGSPAWLFIDEIGAQ